MVSSRRTVRTEQDRFGGYGLSPVKRSENIETESGEYAINIGDSVQERGVGRMAESRIRLPENETRVAVPTEAPRRKAEFEYSGREEYPATAEFVGYEFQAPTRLKKSPRRPKEDFMPSIAGVQDRSEQAAVKAEAKPHKRERTQLSGKTKAMLFLYMGVVAIMAVAVIGIGIAVSNLTADVSSLEREVAARNTTIMQQNQQIDVLTDRNYIAGVAMGTTPVYGTDEYMDMERIDTEKEITPVELSPGITYEKRTNWFDRFCDWLSKLIGG